MPNLPKKTGFTLIELLIVIVIIGILAAIGLVTFASSQMKSRDARRKADLQQVSRALELYYNDKGQYPADDGSGNMMGCGAGAVVACSWNGVTAFSNTTTGTTYMVKLPADPSSNKYYYVATIVGLYHTKYQLYAQLENLQDKSIIGTTFDCGSGPNSCNYGISSSNTTP